MQYRITPEELKADDISAIRIFVYGSNEAGVNGAGAALFAETELDAVRYKGFGRNNFCFAIPTKDWGLKTLPLNIIFFYVQRFIAHAKRYPEVTFLVTQIGCGLAGYKPEQIAPMFKDTIDLENVYLPLCFWEILNYQENRTEINSLTHEALIAYEEYNDGEGIGEF
jgi:hypothetical protein